jgi:hypothetical protein
MNKTDFKTGDRVTCKINGIEITDAKISVDTDGDLYICQNVQNGIDAQDKLGYKYSWFFYFLEDGITDNDITELKKVEYNAKYSIEELKEKKIAINVRNKEEWKEVVGELLKVTNWYSGNKDVQIHYWDYEKEKSTITFGVLSNSISYGNTDYNKVEGYTIISTDEFFGREVLLSTTLTTSTSTSNDAFSGTVCWENKESIKQNEQMNIIKKIKDLALSKEDRILRENGFEDENGKATEVAFDMIYEEIVEKEWQARRADVASKLLEIKND